MENCMKHRWFNRYLNPLLFLLLGVVGVVFGIYVMYGGLFQNGFSEVSPIGVLYYVIVPFAFSLLMLYISVSIYAFETRKYAISASGLRLSDHKHDYTWNEIQAIYIVAFAASSTMEWYDLVICCFLKKPDSNFRYKILRSSAYPIRHRKSFVTFDYTEELHNKLLTFYQKEIPDLRLSQSVDLKYAKQRNR